MKHFYLLLFILQIFPIISATALNAGDTTDLVISQKNKLATSVKKDKREHKILKNIIGSAVGGLIIGVAYLLYRANFNRLSKGNDQTGDSSPTLSKEKLNLDTQPEEVNNSNINFFHPAPGKSSTEKSFIEEKYQDKDPQNLQKLKKITTENEPTIIKVEPEKITTENEPTIIKVEPEKITTVNERTIIKVEPEKITTVNEPTIIKVEPEKITTENEPTIIKIEPKKITTVNESSTLKIKEKEVTGSTINKPDSLLKAQKQLQTVITGIKNSIKKINKEIKEKEVTGSTINKPDSLLKAQKQLRTAITGIKNSIKKINKEIKNFENQSRTLETRASDYMTNIPKAIKSYHSSKKLLDVKLIKETLLKDENQDILKKYPLGKKNLISLSTPEITSSHTQVNHTKSEFDKKLSKVEPLVTQLKIIKNDLEEQEKAILSILANEQALLLPSTQSRILELSSKTSKLLSTEEHLLSKLSLFQTSLNDCMTLLKTQVSTIENSLLALDNDMSVALPAMDEVRSLLKRLYEAGHDHFTDAIQSLFRQAYPFKKGKTSLKKVKEEIHQLIFNLIKQVHQNIVEDINQQIDKIKERINLKKIEKPTYLTGSLIIMLIAHDYKEIVQEIAQKMKKSFVKKVRNEIAQLASELVEKYPKYVNPVLQTQKPENEAFEPLEEAIRKFIGKLVESYTSLIIYEKLGEVTIDSTTTQFLPSTQERKNYKPEEYINLNTRKMIEPRDPVYVYYYGAPVFRFQPNGDLVGFILAYFRKAK